jgi:two-component system, cell cycle sensor histidine kinase and response regulator CckA
VTDPVIHQIKARIRAIVGLILCAVAGISGWSLCAERSNAIANAEKLAGGYARALAEHSESAFAQADGMLRVLQRDIQRSGGWERVNRPALLREMRRQIGIAPQIGSLFLIDNTGMMLINSGELPGQRISIADRPYFRNYLTTPGLQLSLSRPVFSRLVHRWRFNLMRPLNTPDRPFEGLIALGFESEYFDSFFSPGALGPRGRVLLIRTDGAPLVYSPYLANSFEMDFRDSTLFREKLPNSPAGTYHVRNRLSFEQPSIVSYQRLNRFPVVALVTLNQDDVLASWVRKAAVQTSLMLGLCLVIVILTRLIFSHLDRLQLAQGTVSDQQAELRLKAAQIDAASEAILQVDMQGRLVHFNQALCTLTGYQASELAGRRLHDLEPPENGAMIIPNLERLRECHQASFESAYLAKDGTLVPVEVQARLMHSEGRLLVLSVARDITRRKQADLREQARRVLLEQIATDAPLGDLLVGIVHFVEQELPGAICSVLLADEAGAHLRHGAAPSLPDAYNRAVDGLVIAQGMGSCGTAAFLHQRVVVEDIETHPYWRGFRPAREAGLRSCWSEPIFSSDGDLLGTFAIYHRQPCTPKEPELLLIVSAAHLASIAVGRVRGDERRRALEDQLRQSQKIEAVGQLAAGIAHDFNNLLTPIFVYADMIRRGFQEGHPQLRQIDAVILAAHKASELTRKLLSFGRKQVLSMEVLDLNEVILSFGDIMRTTVRESISIDLRLTPERAQLLGDRGQMEQVLLNLALNAQDAIAGTGAISLETGHLILDEEYARLHPGVRPGPYLLFAFSDDGCGMGEDTLRHIYEPFFTTKEVGRGTGLGLATVYGIVKQHDGYLEVWSRPGEGTTFKIFLPMSQAEAGPAAEPAPGDAQLHDAGSGQVIMLVEDNTMIREMAQELLEGYGYRVLVAGTPSQALELAAGLEGDIDLLVSDVVMPQMNGPELHERLLGRQSRLPVLYISGYTGNVELHKDTLDTETDFLTKPFTLEQFLERIRQILAART